MTTCYFSDINVDTKYWENAYWLTILKCVLLSIWYYLLLSVTNKSYIETNSTPVQFKSTL